MLHYETDAGGKRVNTSKKVMPDFCVQLGGLEYITVLGECKGATGNDTDDVYDARCPTSPTVLALVYRSPCPCHSNKLCHMAIATFRWNEEMYQVEDLPPRVVSAVVIALSTHSSPHTSCACLGMLCSCSLCWCRWREPAWCA